MESNNTFTPKPELPPLERSGNAACPVHPDQRLMRVSRASKSPRFTILHPDGMRSYFPEQDVDLVTEVCPSCLLGQRWLETLTPPKPKGEPCPIEGCTGVLEHVYPKGKACPFHPYTDIPRLDASKLAREGAGLANPWSQLQVNQKHDVVYGQPDRESYVVEGEVPYSGDMEFHHIVERSDSSGRPQPLTMYEAEELLHANRVRRHVEQGDAHVTDGILVLHSAGLADRIVNECVAVSQPPYAYRVQAWTPAAEAEALQRAPASAHAGYAVMTEGPYDPNGPGRLWAPLSRQRMDHLLGGNRTKEMILSKQARKETLERVTLVFNSREYAEDLVVELALKRLKRIDGGPAQYRVEPWTSVLARAEGIREAEAVARRGNPITWVLRSRTSGINLCEVGQAPAVTREKRRDWWVATTPLGATLIFRTHEVAARVYDSLTVEGKNPWQLVAFQGGVKQCPFVYLRREGLVVRNLAWAIGDLQEMEAREELWRELIGDEPAFVFASDAVALRIVKRIKEKNPKYRTQTFECFPYAVGE